MAGETLPRLNGQSSISSVRDVFSAFDRALSDALARFVERVSANLPDRVHEAGSARTDYNVKSGPISCAFPTTSARLQFSVERSWGLQCNEREAQYITKERGGH